ncbi:type IV secretion system DNA-binding domain-containing protein [Pseudocitrobacter faecalis]|uniref:type IV secretion system DNA-binding domain-containing protein n=1 Tax=Pseudocitrobacter faecalis TaxID=1398493 RepID=UPI0040637C72
MEEKIEKTAISIRAVLTNYVKAIRYLQGIENNGESFTIRDWMRGVRERDGKNGWLHIYLLQCDTMLPSSQLYHVAAIAIRELLAMGGITVACGSSPTSCRPCKLPDWFEDLPGGCASLAAATTVASVLRPAGKIFTGRNRRKQ